MKRILIASVICLCLLFIFLSSIAQVNFKYVDIDDNGPQSPWGKSFGDINDDGYDDLLVGGQSGGGLVWYEYPSWVKHTVASDKISTDIEVADIDADGASDIVAIGYDNVLRWYKNSGWQKYVIASGTALHDIEVADFDGDGKLDVVGRDQEYFHNSGNILHLYIQGQTSSSWNHSVIMCTKGEGLVVHDINDDGKPDIVIASDWYENTGNMAAWEKHTYSTSWTYHSCSVAIGDMNSDGFSDVVLSPSEVAGNYYKVAWYEQPIDLSSEWVEHIVVGNIETVLHFVGVADFNNDGLTDIAISEMEQGSNPDEVAIFLNQDNGNNWEKQVLATTGSHNMRILDVGNDGDWDLFGANWNGQQKIELWENMTNPEFISLDNWERHVVDPNKAYQSVFIDGKDINGDGLSDIITGGWWYLNPGNAGGTWTKYTIGSPLNNMAYVYDFDGDGDNDILGTEGQGSSSNPNFVWAQNNGSGSFVIHDNIEAGQGDFLQGIDVIRAGNEIPFKIALSWHTANQGIQTLTVPEDPVNKTWTWEKISSQSQDECLSAGDIDKDGNIDLLQGTRWLRNDGNEWDLHILYITSDSPDRNKLVDMNGDGRLDAVVGYEAISVTGKLAWYEQPQVFSGLWTEHLIANVVGPMSVDAVDMDGDNDIDVVVGEHNLSNPSSARMLVYENVDGLGNSWKQHEVYQGDESHDGAVTVDIDNDGDLDILTIGWGHNRVLLYENKSNIASSILNHSLLSDELMVFPNPAKGHVTLKLENSTAREVSIVISDIQGRRLYVSEVEKCFAESNCKRIDLTGFPTGIYIVRVKAGDKYWITS